MFCAFAMAARPTKRSEHRGRRIEPRVRAYCSPPMISGWSLPVVPHALERGANDALTDVSVKSANGSGM